MLMATAIEICHPLKRFTPKKAGCVYAKVELILVESLNEKLIEALKFLASLLSIIVSIIICRVTNPLFKYCLAFSRLNLR